MSKINSSMDSATINVAKVAAEDGIKAINAGRQTIAEYVKLTTGVSRKVAEILDDLVSVLLVLNDHASLVNEIVTPKPNPAVRGFDGAITALGYGSQKSSLYAIMIAGRAARGDLGKVAGSGNGWNVPIEMIRAGVGAQLVQPFAQRFLAGTEEERETISTRSNDLINGETGQLAAGTGIKELRKALNGAKGSKVNPPVVKIVKDAITALQRKLARRLSKVSNPDKATKMIKRAEREMVALVTDLFAKMTREIAERGADEESDEEESAAA